MIIIPPPKTPHRPRRKIRAAQSSPAATLNLIEVIYPADSGLAVQLRFDMDISIGSFNASQIMVSDSDAHELRQGFGGGALVDPQTVQVELAAVGPFSGENDLLSASADNGIVAVEDGTQWAGVTGLVLPYP